MRSRRPALLLGAALLLAPLSVEATCMPPLGFVSPASGTRLPANPVVFVFMPWRAGGPEPFAVDLSLDSGAVAHTVETVSTTAAFTTYRIAVAAAAPGTLRVSVVRPKGVLRPIEATFPIVESIATPSPAKPQVGSPWSEQSRWTCSYQATWNLPLAPDAPAYRVEWAGSRVSYEAGARHDVVFPRRMDSFFRWDETKAEPSPPQVELGHVDCMATTVKWPGKRIWVGVWALLADGSEIELTDQPIPLLNPD